MQVGVYLCKKQVLGASMRTGWSQRHAITNNNENPTLEDPQSVKDSLWAWSYLQNRFSTILGYCRNPKILDLVEWVENH